MPKKQFGFSSLGSGSKGNALLVSTSDGITRTSVLLDCGFGVREMERRLERAGHSSSAISAIVITHEHNDHAGSVIQFATKYAIPVWMSHGTCHALGIKKNEVDICLCRDGDQIAIGDLQFTAFTVPHDAREPLQFHITNGEKKLGVLTDAGQVTPHLGTQLEGCDALILECNHDRDMLMESAYPYFLKKRISSAQGHLSNDEAASFLQELDQTRLTKIIGAHLSQQNNKPEFARDKLSRALKSAKTEIIIACQENGFGWMDVS